MTIYKRGLVGYCETTTDAWVQYPLGFSMRTKPTLLFIDGSPDEITLNPSGTHLTNLSVYYAYDDVLLLRAEVASGLTPGEACALRPSADMKLVLDAEI